MFTPAQALEYSSAWAATVDLGGSDLPLMTVDLRDLDRSFLKDSQEQQLAAQLVSSSWVNVAVVDDELDPAFASLADSFDVLIGDHTHSDAAVDTTGVEDTLFQLTEAVGSSPRAAVELVRLLRLTHALPVEQALHAESLTYGVLQTSEHFQQWLRGLSLQTRPEDPVQDVVQMERTDSLLRITLNRPGQRNALNTAIRDQLSQALELVDLDRSIDGAILAGAGSNFCAGGDLVEFGTTPSASMGHYVRMLRSLGGLLHRVRDRVRVHVHGSCVGAGIELPAFSSSVIAHPNATFRLPEVGFGLVPGAGGTVSLTRRCGRHRAAWLALTGATIDANQALQWQIVDRIDERVFDHAAN